MKKGRERIVKQHVLYSAAFLLGLLLLLAVYIIYLQGFGADRLAHHPLNQRSAQAEAEGISWSGDPDCSIPEQLAVQKLFLHQAAIDSVEVSESEIASGIDRQIDAWIQYAGSKEKLEEYRQMSISQMRQQPINLQPQENGRTP